MHHNEGKAGREEQSNARIISYIRQIYGKSLYTLVERGDQDGHR